MSEQPTNRLRTPAQAAAAIHSFLEWKVETYVDAALEEDADWLNRAYEAEEYRENRKTAIVAEYLQSIELDRWTRTEYALPDRQDYCLIGLLPKWQDRFGEQPLRALWWEEHQFWDSDATGRLYPADVVYWQYVPSLPAA